MKIGSAKKIVGLSFALLLPIAVGKWLYHVYLNSIHRRYYPLNLRNLQSLAERLNVKLTVVAKPISIQDGKNQILAKPADIKYLNFYLPKFIVELSQYPCEVISKIELKEVIISGDLKLDQHPRGGMHSRQLNMLFFDGRYVTADRWTRQIIHHEMFHLLDWKDGIVYHDREWEKLNPEEFKYGSGGISLQLPSDWTAGVLDPHLKGFLNRYAMSGVEEDKAEMFAHMMIDYKTIALRAERDSIIKAKMSQMKKLLYGFCPAFDEAFWFKINERKPLSD